MEVSSAIELVNRLVLFPGWKITAVDHTNRFEGSIKVRIDYPGRNTNRDQAPGYDTEIDTYAEFPLIVAECDDVGLYRRIANAVGKISEHEIREILRVMPTMWAPFHPHRIDGMKRWNATAGLTDDPLFGDLQFGIA